MTRSALHAVVTDPPGAPVTLALHDADGAVASVALEPVEAIVLARQLLATVPGWMSGPLSDPTQERYAQLRAVGKSQADAYEAIGFRRSESNSTRYEKNHPGIKPRITELKAEVAEQQLAGRLPARPPSR